MDERQINSQIFAGFAKMIAEICVLLVESGAIEHDELMTRLDILLEAAKEQTQASDAPIAHVIKILKSRHHIEEPAAN